MKIKKIVPGGQGISELSDGKKIFLWNVLPGEDVEEFEITKKKNRYLEGIATRISKKSEFRVEPKDECFLSTSPWQIFDYDFELKTKGEIVKECFRQNGIEISVPEVLTDGKEWNYRNKMEYGLYWDNQEEKIKLAFHQRGSHRKVPVRQSSIERPELFEYASKIVLELNERHEEARKYQSLLLRTSQDGNVSGGLYENGKAHPQFDSLSDEILGVSYNYSPNGFFQINLPVYEMALREIKENLGDSRKVLDLYSGVGTIGLSVARDKELTLVECDKSCFEEMKNNCLKVGGGAKPILAKSEETLNFIEPEMTVILDPPRAGCDKKLLEKILEVFPKKVIYLSCNPITQARDVAILTGENIVYDINNSNFEGVLDGFSGKYIIRRVKAFNFFPKTPHIENLVILERK